MKGVHSSVRQWLSGSALAAVTIAAVPLAGAAQNQTLSFTKLGDGVYAAIYSEFRMDPIEGNSLVVIGDEDVLVLDSGHTPDAARTVMAEIRKLTTRPVRYLVNSHWHDDHIFGNSGYADAFPRVEIIAHRNTREDMETKVLPSLKDYGLEYWKKMGDGFEAQLAKGTRPDGTPLTEAQRTRLQEQARAVREFLPKIPALRVVLPTATFDRELTLHLGRREVRLIHFGPGNTRGDVAVYLPRERILATGDLLVHPIPFAYGSHMAEWVQTLKAARQLEADVIVPGHGPVMRDKEYLDTVIALFESLVAQVAAAVTQGLTLEATRKAVDLDEFRTRLAGDDAFRRATFNDSILREAVTRAYQAASRK
jgi:glyoxylase-like metal-dependent hydrolase (beta-lactamase superfamily II)